MPPHTSQTSTRSAQPYSNYLATWPDSTELLGLTLTLQPTTAFELPPQYTTELHSWFLDQVRRLDYQLSSNLHDGQSEKPFTVSGLNNLSMQRSHYAIDPKQAYEWRITLLSTQVVNWLQTWLLKHPQQMELRSGSFRILDLALSQPPTTYKNLWLADTPTSPTSPTLSLQFISPTSFRHKGNHLPLPIPENLFHSYLRRWNDFSEYPIDQTEFLSWVDQAVVILRHHIQSTKVMAGKRGAVTGFTGSIQLGVSKPSQQPPEMIQAFLALGQFAPYCGTGHKTTFGLGQTRLGWSDQPETTPTATFQDLLAHRISVLTEQFTAQRKRQGGERTQDIATTWATILARREFGEAVPAIAKDLEMPYETVKTYVKLARRALRNAEVNTSDG